MVRSDPTMANLTFDQWLARKKEEERRRTHGAERIDIPQLYDAQTAIDNLCFDGKFRYIPMYFIPEDLRKNHSEANALYGYGCIMLNRGFYQDHGMDAAVVNTIFHEMVHAFCDLEGVKATNGTFHTEGFAAVCRNHGGTCDYSGPEDGYNLAALTPENMKAVQAQLR